MSFSKKVPKKSAEKKCRKKVPENADNKTITNKTQMHYEKILSHMQPHEWYKTNDFVGILDVKERRIKILLHDLVQKDLLIEEGTTKAKKFKKK